MVQTTNINADGGRPANAAFCKAYIYSIYVDVSERDDCSTLANQSLPQVRYANMGKGKDLAHGIPAFASFRDFPIPSTVN